MYFYVAHTKTKWSSNEKTGASVEYGEWDLEKKTQKGGTSSYEARLSERNTPPPRALRVAIVFLFCLREKNPNILYSNAVCFHLVIFKRFYVKLLD